MQHNLLESQDKRCVCINVKYENEHLDCGFFYCNHVQSTTQIVNSITGFAYEITLPESYLHLRDACQYNAILAAKKVEIQNA